MPITEDSFFTENIVKINKRINFILFCADLVPLFFIILTKLGVWYVPTSYAISIFIYNTIISTICFFLNRSQKKLPQHISMYLGLIAVSGFVFLLGMKGVIVVTVSFAFASFLSCLYYNRRLTNVITIVNFVLIVIAYKLRAPGVTLVVTGIKTADRWFIENVPGVIVEFVFVYLSSDSLARRTSATLRRLTSLNADMNGAYRRLNEKNVEQFNLNKELQDKNAYIEKLNTELNSRNANLSENQYKIIEFVVSCLGNYDIFGVTHNYHTGKFVQEICYKLRKDGHYTEELTDEVINRYMLAALLHDVGKLRVPKKIVNKVGKYTEEEYEIMKSHPMEGRKILESLPPIDEGKFNVTVKEMALYHHERWDGSGYPYGVTGETIPLCARIMAAADVLDALINPRLYKDPVSMDEAVKVFEEEKGKMFEPCIADAIIDMKEELSVVNRDLKTYEATKLADNLAWWQKYHPELKEALGKTIK